MHEIQRTMNNEYLVYCPTMSDIIEILSTKWAYIIYDKKKYITIYCLIGDDWAS